MLGTVPALGQHFEKFVTEVLEAGPLEDRELAIAVLTVAFAMEEAETVKRAVVAGKQAGLANEEIGHISAVVIAMRGQKIAGLGQVMAPSSSSTGQSTCCR